MFGDCEFDMSVDVFVLLFVDVLGGLDEVK